MALVAEKELIPKIYNTMCHYVHISQGLWSHLKVLATGATTFNNGELHSGTFLL